MLTVCSTEACMTQSIQWFSNEAECSIMKEVHEEFPKDGNWKLVDYECTVLGAKKV
jgi:hypothetical protein